MVATFAPRSSPPAPLFRFSPMSKSRDFLGPYRLARLIRLGSTCEVWEAIEDGTDKRFALKILRQSMRDDKNEVAQLKHEFAVAKDLSGSPRIIKVLEYRTEGGAPFLVMGLEWLRATTSVSFVE